jgi:hypothetical protein
VAALAASPAHASTPRIPSLAPGEDVVAGPGPSIVGLGGLSVARDGSGGLVYLQNVAGVAHVYVSRLTAGTFVPPVEVDPGLTAASSQPVIAAGNGGVLLIAFVNAGGLYESTWAAGQPLPSPPVELYGAAANPSLSMSNFGKAYLAFTATDGAGGGDVRCAFYYQGQWALESAPLDNRPADPAGLGDGRPQVATAGDGTAIVVWGEDGHIYSRRVVGTSPSVVDEQADPPSAYGWAETGAGATDPAVAVGGDDSYATVAFEEELESVGVPPQTRVLINRLRGSQYDGATPGDGALTGGPEGADQPQVAVTEYGDGFVTSELASSHELFATRLAADDVAETTARIDSLPDAGAADAVPAVAGLTSTLVAWQQSPGVAGPAEIRVRYAPDGFTLGPEQVISDPALGPADADLGLFAGGDTSGDAAVAWVQGTPGDLAIVAAQLYDPPGAFSPAAASTYANVAQPPLAWSAAAELWGPVEYLVRVDGTPLVETQQLSVAPPLALADGRHTWQVSAANQAGISTEGPLSTVFIDTVPPQVTFTLAGRRVRGAALRIDVRCSDLPPPGLPATAASGVRTVQVAWGDGTVTDIRRDDAVHTFTRARSDTITVTAVDRAGNRTAVSRRIVIRAPRPHRRRGRLSARRRRSAAAARGSDRSDARPAMARRPRSSARRSAGDRSAPGRRSPARGGR